MSTRVLEQRSPSKLVYPLHYVISAHGWLANNRTEREMLRHPLALETTRNSTANGPFSITEIFVTISAKGWFSFAGSQVKVSAPSLPT